MAGSLERNDCNQFPLQLRVVSFGIHRHRILVDSMKRRMTDLLQMFLLFGFRPESLLTFLAIEKWLRRWWVLVLSPDVFLQVPTPVESLRTVKTPVGGFSRMSAQVNFLIGILGESPSALATLVIFLSRVNALVCL